MKFCLLKAVMLDSFAAGHAGGLEMLEPLAVAALGHLVEKGDVFHYCSGVDCRGILPVSLTLFFTIWLYGGVLRHLVFF